MKCLHFTGRKDRTGLVFTQNWRRRTSFVCKPYFSKYDLDFITFMV